MDDETTVNKTTTTLNVPRPPRMENPRLAQWKEAREVFPIYLALAKQQEIDIPFPQAQRNLPEKPDTDLFTQIHEWLDAMDQKVMAHQLRHLLQMTTLNASENSLRALIRRHLRKPKKSNPDRDKIDFLLVQYFALCAPAKIYHKQIELDDVAQVMQPVLGEVDPAPLDWCAPLEKMILALRAFRGLREILKTNFIEEGRKVKEGAGGMWNKRCKRRLLVSQQRALRRASRRLLSRPPLQRKSPPHPMAPTPRRRGRRRPRRENRSLPERWILRTAWSRFGNS